MSKKNPFEMLLDENNNENIIFYDAGGQPMEFEQVAVLSVEGQSYAILHPVNMGYAKDEVIAYSISQEDNQYELLEVEDTNLLEQIDDEYQRLYKKNKR